jgi:hypothetical protein
LLAVNINDSREYDRTPFARNKDKFSKDKSNEINSWKNILMKNIKNELLGSTDGNT